MGKGHGYGKCILFNEHFVVYGIPSIVSAIGMKTEAEVKRWPGPGLKMEDERPATPGYKEEKLKHHEDAVRRVFNFVGIDPEQMPVRVHFAGDLYAASGVGASAAACTALVRALNEEFHLGWDDDKINQGAYEGEKGYHGTPSGVDNSAATYGGLLWFQKGEKNLIEKIKIPQPVEIVMGNTGKVANTKKAVAGVRERKEQFPDTYADIFEKATKLAHDARAAITAGDIPKVAELMNHNHELLQQIEVSNDELDFLVELARKEGAAGAKMTGGGLGGYMVALTPGKELQEKVAAAMEAEGYRVLRTVVGV